jgi:eukaryotic-like serine/threonine-protein kinase
MTRIAMDNAGRVLSGRYRLLEQIGKGGMGTVWRAEHVELGSLCAIKLIDDDLAQSVIVRTRFRREAKAAAALNSDHVVKTFDYGVDGGTPYIVMELLTGESLDQRLKRVGRLSPQELLNVLIQVALALDRAHERGLVHRDLKPGNLFIGKDDTGKDCVKLLDFGIAKSLRNDDDLAVGPTRTGALVGSPAYMSPEQLRNVGGIDQTSDIWSLGIVAYEALVGQRPFAATTIADLIVRICTESLPVPSSMAEVPPGFDAWFAKACDRDARARFSTATELVMAFQRMLASAQIITAQAVIARNIDVPSHSSHSRPASTGSPARALQESLPESSTTGGHRRSTEPLSRTADEPLGKSSSRTYWLLAGAGLTLVGLALFGGKGHIVTPTELPTNTAQTSGSAQVGAPPWPLEAERRTDAGLLGASEQLETGPGPLASPAIGSRRITRGITKKAPSTAPSPASSKFVPDSVYGF